MSEKNDKKIKEQETAPKNVQKKDTVVENHQTTETLRESFPEYFNKNKWFFVLFFALGMFVMFVLFAVGVQPSELSFLGIKFNIPSQDAIPDLSADQATGRIESFPTKVFPFSGKYNSNNGVGFLDVEFRQDGSLFYYFTFDLPTDGTYGYAGFTFWFINPNDPNLFAPPNLEGFSSIQITLKLKSSLHLCQLLVKDIDYIMNDETNHVNYLQLSQTAPPNSKLEINGNEYTYTISLNNFNKVDLKKIREIGFLVDTSVPQDERSFAVKEIRFVP